MDYAKRVKVLERQLALKNQQIQDLKERNLVLEQRENFGRESTGAASTSDDDEGVSITSLPVASEKQIPAVPKAKPVATAESVTTSQSSDQLLYSKVLETYRRRDRKEIAQAVQLLLKSEPDSVFADNALYLAGLLFYESDDLPKARQYMERVVREYPKRNKAVSALYALSSIDRREKHYSTARRELIKIRDQYPGSPEASRVAMELKVVDLASKGSKQE